MLDSKLLKAIRALGKTEISWLSKCLSQAVRREANGFPTL